MSPHHGARVPPPRRNREHHPSFSAALLDAIYQSLDADGARTPTDPRRAPVSPAERSPRPLCSRHRPSTTLSPSASSARSPRPQKPPRPCRVRPDPQPSLLVPPPPPTGDGAEKKRIRRKKAKSAPFACLLNALLCNRKSAKSVETTTSRAVPAVAAEPASARSIISSRTSWRESAAEPASARSILSSRASRRESAVGAGGVLTPGRRAVRFSPAVEVVVDGEHRREARTARLHEAAGTKVAAAQESAAEAEAERRVEELLRVLGAAEERERAKESSESSSDLFELETLTALDDTRAAGAAEAARFVRRDGCVIGDLFLPVRVNSMQRCASVDAMAL